MKKRFLSVIITLSMICAILPTVTFAKTYGDLEYEINKSSVSITGYYGFSSEVVIPEKIEALPVISIGEGVFYGCKNLTSIIIPSSIISIGNSAFEGCDNLESVYISDIASYLNINFYNNTSNPMYYADKLYINNQQATTIEIPEGVTNISPYAFEGCDSLTSITIPDSVASIGKYAFYNCTGLDSVYISDIAKWCTVSFENSFSNPLFYADLYINNELATDINVPDNVTSICDYAFAGCSRLKSITIPNNVTSIGMNSFLNCSNLTSIILGNGISTIGDSAFYHCDSLESVYISDLAKWCGISFSDSASNPLYYAGNLYINNELPADIVIPDSVTSISKNSFMHCSNLKKIFIPTSVTEIEMAAFKNCNNLTEVEYGGSQADWDEIYIGIDNECLTNANISFGKTSPTPEPDENYPYTINDLSLKNTSGEEIAEAPINKGFMVNVDFTKLMMRNLPDYIFVAVYDTDGAFLSLDYVQSNFAENYTYNIGFYIQPQKKEIGKIKAFVWNSFNDTTPLAEVKEL
jgi:hypothetical protein